MSAKPRNKLQALLKEHGLPRLKGHIARELAQLWRYPEAQKQIVKALTRCYREVKKYGKMTEESKAKFAKLLDKWGIADPTGSYFQALRAMYKRLTKIPK